MPGPPSQTARRRNSANRAARLPRKDDARRFSAPIRFATPTLARVSVLYGLLARLRAALGESKAKSLRRRLRAAAPASLAELREGMHCRITGTVRALDHAVLESPLAGERSVAYVFEIVADTSGVRDLIGYDKRAVPFVLAEGEHHAIIEPAYAELVADASVVVSTIAYQADEHQMALLRAHCPLAQISAATRLRFRETRVVVGGRIAIAGTGHREADPMALRELGFREQAERLRLAGAPGLPLLIGDPVD